MQLQQSVTAPNIYRTRLVSICSYNRLSPHPKYTRHVRYVFAVTTVCHCTQHLPDTFGMYLQLQQSVTVPSIYRPRSVCICSYNSLSPLPTYIGHVRYVFVFTTVCYCTQHIPDTFDICVWVNPHNSLVFLWLLEGISSGCKRNPWLLLGFHGTV